MAAGRSAALVVLVLLFPSNVIAAPLTQYRFTKIADTQGQIGDTVGEISSFPVGLSRPAINDSGQVVFGAVLKTGEHGIFLGTGGPLTTITDTISGDFSAIQCCPTINNSGAVAFTAYRKNGIEGVYTIRNSVLTTIVEHTATALVNSFAQPSINDSGTVAFRAYVSSIPGVDGDGGGQRIFKGNGGALTEVAETGGLFYELESAPAINSDGLVAFDTRLFLGGLTSGGSGIFIGNGGSPQAIATTRQFTPSSMFFGLSNTPAIDDLGRAIFPGLLEPTGRWGLFAGDGIAIMPIIDPLGPIFAGTDAPAVSRNGKLAFVGSFALGGVGIFTGSDPIANKVISSADVLFGSIVSLLNLSREGINRSGQIAFFAHLSDGTSGIYRADPVTQVSIDIKPGDFPNSVNPTDKGVTPVAILSSTAFDAASVDASTVRFGVTGTEATALTSALEDVNNDGLPDMVLHFGNQDTGIKCGTTSEFLTGTTFTGQAVQGTDSIRTVGCN